MTPDQVQTITAIVAIIKAMGALPLGVIVLLIFVGPWVGMAVITHFNSNNLDKALKRNMENAAHHEKRFVEVVRMYENNVELVNDYNKLANDLAGIITLSTRTLEGLVQRVDNNQWCPIARKATGRN